MDRVDKTNLKKNAVLKSIADGATIAAASRAAGIAHNTYYLWLQKDSKFKKKVEEAETHLIESIEKAGIKHARGYDYDEVSVSPKDGTKVVTKHIPANPALNIFYICNLLSKKYRNVQRVEHSGKITEELKLSDADRKEFRKLAELIVKAKSHIK